MTPTYLFIALSELLVYIGHVRLVLVPFGCSVCPWLQFQLYGLYYFLARVVLVRVSVGCVLFRVARCGIFDVCEPVVGGKRFSDVHTSKHCLQYLPSTLLRVRLVLLIASKLKGPSRIRLVSSRFTSSAHCTNFLLSGMRVGGNRILFPKIMSPVSLHFLYLYQSGHHLLNSSLFSLSWGCFARNPQ